MNNNLRRFDRFSGQAKFTVPNHLRHAGYDRLTRATLPWQGATAISKAKEKTNIDQLWATAEQNIVNEQAIKEVQKDLVNRETARMIYRLNQRDNARNALLYPNFKTEIQEFNSAVYQPRQYSAGGIVAPGVGIDDVEGYALFARRFSEENREEIENLVNEVGRSTARVLGDAFQSKLISKLPIPIGMKMPIHILIFLYCAYQCAQSAYNKEVVPYMREHNCSLEEAAENTAVERAFFAEFGKLLLTTYVGMVASTFDISERTQFMIDALVGEVVERIFG